MQRKCSNFPSHKMGLSVSPADLPAMPAPGVQSFVQLQKMSPNPPHLWGAASHLSVGPATRANPQGARMGAWSDKLWLTALCALWHGGTLCCKVRLLPVMLPTSSFHLHLSLCVSNTPSQPNRCSGGLCLREDYFQNRFSHLIAFNPMILWKRHTVFLCFKYIDSIFISLMN